MLPGASSLQLCTWGFLETSERVHSGACVCVSTWVFMYGYLSRIRFLPTPGHQLHTEVPVPRTPGPLLAPSPASSCIFTVACSPTGEAHCGPAYKN